AARGARARDAHDGARRAAGRRLARRPRTRARLPGEVHPARRRRSGGRRRRLGAREGRRDRGRRPARRPHRDLGRPDRARQGPGARSAGGRMTREQSDAPLAPLTTLEVGGAARRLLTATTRAELVSAITAAEAEVDDWLLLGGGSNVVIADTGFDGTVVRVATRGIERLPDAAVARPIRLRVEAGEPWDDVVAAAVGNGWAGIETLSGI